MRGPWSRKKRPPAVAVPTASPSGQEMMKSEVAMPKKIRIAVEDIAFQLEMTPDAVLMEGFLAHLPALETRRKALEAHVFPKPIFSSEE